MTGTAEDGLGGIVGLQRDGWLSCLDIHNAGEDPIAVFPRVQTIGFELDAGEASP